MKCPKCGFVTFDNIDKCKKCGKILYPATEVRQKDNVIKLQRSEVKTTLMKNEEIQQRKEFKLSDNKKVDSSVERMTISPIPKVRHLQQATPDIFAQEDDFDLITEKLSDHITLDKLPVLPRLLSFVIDLSMLFFVNAALVFLSAYVIGTNISSLFTMKLYFIILFLLMYYLYYIYFTLIHNATPGQMIMHLKVISLATLRPAKLSFQQLTWRWLSMMGSIIFLFIGIIYMLFDDVNATLFDRLSLSIVVSEEQFYALKGEELNR